MAVFSENDPEANDKMRHFFSPSQLHLSVRQAISMCWMMLPGDKRTSDELERQFRRIVDRAFADLREDHEAFGLGK